MNEQKPIKLNYIQEMEFLVNQQDLELDWVQGMTEGADPKMRCHFQLGQMGKLPKQGNLEGELLEGKIFREEERLYIQLQKC